VHIKRYQKIVYIVIKNIKINLPSLILFLACPEKMVKYAKHSQ